MPSYTSNPSPSHMFSLPTIVTQPLGRSTPTTPRGAQTQAHSTSRSRPSTIHTKKRRSGAPRLSTSVERGWRISQEWIGRAGRMSRRDEEDPLRPWSRHEDVEEVKDPHPFHFDYRRPSEHNSISPLLAPRYRIQSLSTNHLPMREREGVYPVYSPLLTVEPESSASASYSPSTASLPSPPPSVTMSRHHSFASAAGAQLAQRRRSEGVLVGAGVGTGMPMGLGPKPGPGPDVKASQPQQFSPQSPQSTSLGPSLFDNTNPFAPARSAPTPAPTSPFQAISGRRPSLCPSTSPDRRQGGDRRPDDPEAEIERAKIHWIMSFQDMLEQGPPVPGPPRKRSFW